MANADDFDGLAEIAARSAMTKLGNEPGLAVRFIREGGLVHTHEGPEGPTEQITALRFEDVDELLTATGEVVHHDVVYHLLSSEIGHPDPQRGEQIEDEKYQATYEVTKIISNDGTTIAVAVHQVDVAGPAG